MFGTDHEPGAPRPLGISPPLVEAARDVEVTSSRRMIQLLFCTAHQDDVGRGTHSGIGAEGSRSHGYPRLRSLPSPTAGRSSPRPALEAHVARRDRTRRARVAGTGPGSRVRRRARPHSPVTASRGRQRAPQDRFDLREGQHQSRRIGLGEARRQTRPVRSHENSLQHTRPASREPTSSRPRRRPREPAPDNRSPSPGRQSRWSPHQRSTGARPAPRHPSVNAG
jgi:hypothetical protein